MAISYVTTGNASGTTSASLAMPGLTNSLDCMIVVKCDRATSGTTTAPTGWTRVASAAAVSNYRIEAFWGILGANGIGRGPWSFTGTTRTLVLCNVYRGVDITTPMDVTASARSNASGTYGALAITPVTNDNWVIAGFSFPANNYTWSAETASGVTLAERSEAAYSTYADIAIADGTQGTAQSTGNTSATPSSAAVNGGCILSLRPGSAWAAPPDLIIPVFIA